MNGELMPKRSRIDALDDRRLMPSFLGSKHHKAITQWLGGPVDDTDTVLGDGGGGSGEGGIGMSAEDPQGSRYQAGEASRNDVTGSLGVASPLALRRIKGGCERRHI